MSNVPVESASAIWVPLTRTFAFPMTPVTETVNRYGSVVR